MPNASIILRWIVLSKLWEFILILMLNNEITFLSTTQSCHCMTMSSEIISSTEFAINNVRSTCEEDVLSTYVSQNVSTLNSNNSRINSNYFIEVFILSKKTSHIYLVKHFQQRIILLYVYNPRTFHDQNTCQKILMK